MTASNLRMIGVAMLCFVAGVQLGNLQATRLEVVARLLPSSEWIRVERPTQAPDACNCGERDDGYHIATSDMTNKKPSYDLPVEKIILIGERHSGTNWITDHLRECFGGSIEVSDYYRHMKHSFHEEDPIAVPPGSAVVVAMFRDPYDWVEAMRLQPHHAHDHVNWTRGEVDYDTGWIQQGGVPLDWMSFVTRPWIGRRGSKDEELRQTPGGIEDAVCLDNYSFVDLAPCSEEDSPILAGLGWYKYERRHDGSERGYASVIELRRDKILNHLSVSGLLGVRAYLPFRYEDLMANGTGALLHGVEGATGLEAQCNATLGRNGRGRRRRLSNNQITMHEKLPDDFIVWMNKYIDWDVERRVGYYRREV